MVTSKPFKSVDAYIATFPKEVRGILEKVRKAIKSVARGAEETTSYNIPAFKLQGKRLVYFAAFKHHIGLYPPAPKAFAKEVGKYAGPKGNLKFPLDEPMPLGLIKRIVQYKVKEMPKGKW